MQPLDNLTCRTLGEFKSHGAESHVLTVAEMPVHNHSSITGGQSNSHTHSVSHQLLRCTHPGSLSGNGIHYFQPEGAPWPDGRAAVNSGDASADHSHSISNDGNGLGHNNMQPFVVVNYIIKV